GTNLGRLDQLNTLCRDICAAPADYKSIRERLDLILRHNSYAGWQLCLATGGIGFFFTLLFSGGLAEAGCAFVACMILWLLTTGMHKINANPLFVNVIGGFWVALSGLLCYWFGLIPAYGTMIVGSIMFLVPGLPITNAIRDLIAGDSIAGITKFAEALLVGAGIAVGAALPLSFAGYFGG
ncbi:MAG: threonine/serine exporter family protein, partial [Butyricicoccus sp.]